MYLVTAEDGDGMWFDDPIVADTKDEASEAARKKWQTLPQHIALVLYACRVVAELHHPQDLQRLPHA